MIPTRVLGIRISTTADLLARQLVVVYSTPLLKNVM